jgi:hypothetical protein
MTMKKYLFLLILMTLLSGLGISQDENPVLKRISGNLEKLGQTVPFEKVCLITDKQIYSPGELIWFSGFVFDRSGGIFSRDCPEISVILYHEEGEQIISERYIVRNGRTYGDLLLPENLALGRYYLVAYTPAQVNPEDVFVSEILVEDYYKGDVSVVFPEPEKIYEAGKPALVGINVVDAFGQPADRAILNYKIRHGQTIPGEGKVKSESGRATISVPVPEKTGSIPVELIVSHPRKRWTRKLPLKSESDEIKLSFYVEGQHLLGTVPQKVGFYATTWGGNPVSLEGDLIGSSGDLIAKVKTMHPGFGIFSYKPSGTGRDKLVITSDYGNGQSFELPAIGTGQAAWAVGASDGHFITADLLVSGRFNQNLTVTATRGTRLLWASGVMVDKSSRIKIPVYDLEPGVIRLDAFNGAGEHLTSRLMNIPGEAGLHIAIDAIQEEKGKLRITLTTKDENDEPVDASLSLSVADIMRKEGTFAGLDDFILSGGELIHPFPGTAVQEEKIPGRKTLPEWYLISNEQKTFPLEQIRKLTDSVYQIPSFVNSGISGRITDKNGNPAGYSKISIMNSRDMRMYSVIADRSGFFGLSFDTPVGWKDLTVSAVSQEGKGGLVVKKNPVFAERTGIYIQTLGHSFRENLKTRKIAEYLGQNPFLLKDQPVVKPSKPEQKKQREEPYKTLLLSATSLLDVIRVIKPYTLINNQIVFYGTINSIMAQSGALIVIDGQKMGTQIDVLQSLNPHDIDKISISLDPMDIQKYTGLNNVGVIEIETKRGVQVADTPGNTPPVANLVQDGYRIPRDFLSGEALRGQQGRDLRTTLYWNPSIRTGSSGTFSFTIPISEIVSDFVISAEGTGPDGVPGSCTKIFQVK